MAVLNDLDRYHRVGNAIDRVSKPGYKTAWLKQFVLDTLIERMQYIARDGRDLTEIRAWMWPP
mgnify:CR=1 FL=1